MKELAGDGIPVTVSCRVLDLARQPYYRWLDSPISDNELDDAYLANAIFDAHRDDPEFGHRFLADEARLAGHSVCDRTVWKICSENGWWCSFAKKKSRKKSSPATAAHDDLVRRVFTADAPDQLWLTDLTEHRTDEGKLYLCAIKDLWSNRIIGYSTDDRMKARLVVAAANNAVARRGDVAGCILHSDRGSQFRARKVHRAFARHEMVGSMGHTRRTPYRDRDLDRTHLPPPPTPRPTRPIDPNRIRNHHDTNRRNGGLTNLSPKRAADPLRTCRLRRPKRVALCPIFVRTQRFWCASSGSRFRRRSRFR